MLQDERLKTFRMSSKRKPSVTHKVSYSQEYRFEKNCLLLGTYWVDSKKIKKPTPLYFMAHKQQHQAVLKNTKFK